jgi:hypothetical protein
MTLVARTDSKMTRGRNKKLMGAAEQRDGDGGRCKKGEGAYGRTQGNAAKKAFRCVEVQQCDELGELSLTSCEVCLDRNRAPA